MGTIGLYPKFRADDRDGQPLEGGRLYSYLAGTSTPHSMFADAELTTPLENPIILDASGEALFYTNGQALKWVLRDQADVLQWEIDPVPSGGAGGGTGAGVGWGQFTVAVRPAAGAAQVAASLFPPDVMALGLTLWIAETLGQTLGLTHMGVGSPNQPDRWGVVRTFPAEAATTAGQFLTYSAQPQPESGVVTLTAYGGTFDGTGEVYLTGHWYTLHPSHQEGYNYVSGAGATVPLPLATTDTAGVVELATPQEGLDGLRTDLAVTPAALQAKFQSLPPVQPASELQAGITRYGTDAETVTGTLRTVATHPAGVQAAVAAGLAPVMDLNSTQSAQISGLLTTDATHTSQISALDAKVPPGTPRSVVRYAASGTALETGSATVVIDATGRLGVGQATPLTPLHVVGELRVEAGFVRCNREATNASVILEASGDSATAVYGGLTLSRARGTTASRTAVQAGDRLALVAFQGFGTSFAAGAQCEALAAETFTASARGGILALGTTTLGTTTMAERLRLDAQGRIGVHTALSEALGSGATYQTLSVRGSQLFVAQSSLQERPLALVAPSFVVSTDATREARLSLSVYDATAPREFLRGETASGAARIGFLGAAAAPRQTVPAAATDAGTTQTLANSLRTALITLGLCV